MNLNIIEYIMGVICNYVHYIFKLYISKNSEKSR